MTKMRRTLQFAPLMLLLVTMTGCGDFEWLPDAKSSTTTTTTQNSTTTTTQINSKQMGGSIQTSLSSISQSVTTIAGVLPGAADGIGAAARFISPYGSATDGANLYVADTNNHTIRKVVISTGAVTTLAGTAGVKGSTDGTGAAARFYFPYGIATDGANLYVTDSGNATIRKIIIATGEVTTLAGTAGSAGSGDGVGAAAGFAFPKGITSDGTNLYVADSGAYSIRKIVITTGEVTTLAGVGGQPGSVDGVGAAARFKGPAGITVAGTNLYVADRENYTIRKIVIASGEVTTLAGMAGTVGYTEGIGTVARFASPEGVAADGTSLYVTDPANIAIRKIDLATGSVSTLVGGAAFSSEVGAGVVSLIFYPQGISTDGTSLYVGDIASQTVRKIDTATGAVTTLAGIAPTGSEDGTGTAARFYYPEGITSDGTNLYIADSNNCTIRKIVIATGSVTTIAGTVLMRGSGDGIGTTARFSLPRGITTDGINLYVADSDSNSIRKIVIATGVVTTLAGGSLGATDDNGASASFNSPHGITTDGTSLYVADTGNHTIRKIAIATGAVTTLAGGAGTAGSADGTGTAALFNLPSGITTDGSSVYVTDTRNYIIRKIIINTGAVSTIAGTVGTSKITDGTGSAAQFGLPRGITSDGTSLYIADAGAIRKMLLATGEVTTLAGGPRDGYADGTGSSAGFAFPRGLTTDGTSLYVVDTQNSSIRKIK